MQHDALVARYNQLVKDYQAGVKTMTDSVKNARIVEADMTKQQLDNMSQQAQDSIQKKKESLMQPIYAKAMKTIEQLTEEKRYYYIVDSNNGNFLYIRKASNGLLPAAKMKLAGK